MRHSAASFCLDGLAAWSALDRPNSAAYASTLVAVVVRGATMTFATRPKCSRTQRDVASFGPDGELARGRGDQVPAAEARIHAEPRRVPGRRPSC